MLKSTLENSINKIRKVSKKGFVRNVFIVASGTAAAQVITMLFSPIITRLYGPEAFGILGVFIAVVGIVTPIAALTFPVAVVLPKKDSDAKGLVRLSLYIALVMSTLTAIILILFGEPVVKMLKIEVLAPYLLFIPIVMLLEAGIQVTKQWLIRKKMFKVQARVAIVQALIVNGSKSGAGLFYPFASVLILITTLGKGLYSLMLTRGLSVASKAKGSTEEENGQEYSKTHLLKLAKNYYDFPVYQAPHVFINAISQSLPILMLTAFFSPAAAGFYTIGKRVLGIPSSLIGSAVGDVYYPRISEAVNKNEKVSKLLIKATLSLIIVGLVPFGIVVALGPWLFSIVFGADWTTAGVYASWLALWSFFGFINNPSVKTLQVLSAQKFLLMFSVSATVLRLVGLLVGGVLFNSDITAIILYSIAGVVANIILIVGTIIKSKNYDAR